MSTTTALDTLGTEIERFRTADQDQRVLDKRSAILASGNTNFRPHSSRTDPNRQGRIDYRLLIAGQPAHLAPLAELIRSLSILLDGNPLRQSPFSAETERSLRLLERFYRRQYAADFKAWKNAQIPRRRALTVVQRSIVPVSPVVTRFAPVKPSPRLLPAPAPVLALPAPVPSDWPELRRLIHHLVHLAAYSVQSAGPNRWALYSGARGRTVLHLSRTAVTITTPRGITSTYNLTLSREQLERLFAIVRRRREAAEYNRFLVDLAARMTPLEGSLTCERVSRGEIAIQNGKPQITVLWLFGSVKMQESIATTVYLRGRSPAWASIYTTTTSPENLAADVTRLVITHNEEN